MDGRHRAGEARRHPPRRHARQGRADAEGGTGIADPGRHRLQGHVRDSSGGDGRRAGRRVLVVGVHAGGVAQCARRGRGRADRPGDREAISRFAERPARGQPGQERRGPSADPGRGAERQRVRPAVRAAAGDAEGARAAPPQGVSGDAEGSRVPGRGGEDQAHARSRDRRRAGKARGRRLHDRAGALGEAEGDPLQLMATLFPTTLVGSHPQPEWLIDRQKLASRFPPRVRARELWRVPEPWLAEAQNDATRLAIHDQEAVGLDIVTDGEIRRESYSNRFATALDGIDADNPAIIVARTGQQTPVPRVVGKVRRSRPVELQDMEFLRRNTDRAAKITLPGPFTMSQQAKNEFYEDEEELAMAFAEAVNAEALDLEKAGADVIQLDEPWVRNNPDLARRYAVKAINRALQGIAVPTVVHLCFGYAAVVPGSTKPAGYSFLAELADTSAEQISIEAAQPKLDLGVLRDLSSKKIMLGVLVLGNPGVESADVVADRIRNGLKHVVADRLVVAPDCGMKYMPRHVAFGKLKAQCDAAAAVRKEIS